MKILVTGAKGFIGKNLIAELRNRKYNEVFEYSRESDATHFDKYCKNADFVFHLAGVNRPKEESEFMEGNLDLTSYLLETLKKHGNTCPVMVSSSIQSELDNPYGKSKKAVENLIIEYSKITESKVIIYRLPNVFGKWCRPNYNSAVATFCYNIAHNLPIQVDDPKVVMNLVYIDDVVNELIGLLEEDEEKLESYRSVPAVYNKTLGEIVALLYSFKKSREEKSVPNMSNPLVKKLYSTYLSYLPKYNFRYDLEMNIDERGSFTEFIRTPDRGQFSVNISKPGITKGNHWHHTKNEKFLVVNGKGIIRFREINSKEVIEYFVSGEKMQVIDIPVGYTHNIENIGDVEMVTLMWVNEPYDEKKPDTYYEEV